MRVIIFVHPYKMPVIGDEFCNLPLGYRFRCFIAERKLADIPNSLCICELYSSYHVFLLSCIKDIPFIGCDPSTVLSAYSAKKQLPSSPAMCVSFAIDLFSRFHIIQYLII